MADTFPARIAQAISDPGSITSRQAEGDVWGGEKMTRWQTRAVLQVVSEHVPINVVEPVGHPLGVALLITFNSLVTLVAGLWIGAVWL